MQKSSVSGHSGGKSSTSSGHSGGKSSASSGHSAGKSSSAVRKSSAARKTYRKKGSLRSQSLFAPVFMLLRRLNIFAKRHYRKYRPVGPLWLRGTLFVTICTIMGIIITLCVERIAAGSLDNVWAWTAKYTDPFLLTVFLYAVLLALLGSLIPLWTADAAVSAFGLILALVDYFKRTINGSPLVLADFGLTSHAGDVVDVSGALWPPLMFWQSFGILMLCVAVLFFMEPLTQMKLSRRSGKIRLVSSLTAFVIFFSGLFSLQLGDLFRVDVVTRLNPSSSHNTYGLTVSLWRECNMSRKPPPDEYNENTMRDVLNRVDELLTVSGESASVTIGPHLPVLSPLGPYPQTEAMPNVIMVLSESFFDPSRLSGVTFERDPAVNFHALRSESISGHFFTHYLGYGTGYIEMSMQTGLTSPDLGAATNLCAMDRSVYEHFDALAEQYTHTGIYTAEMLHAYDNSLYNRTVTYPLMGYSRSLYSRDIQKMDIPREIYGGYYMRDSYLFQGVLRELRRINETGNRAFLYAITMENHQPYNPDKFGTDYFYSSGVKAPDLNGDELAVLDVAVEGLARADQALRELTDALRSYPEPVIVVFFGDHRPALSMPDGESLYTKLGLSPGRNTDTWSTEQIADLYSSDYLIWTNRSSLLGRRGGTVKPEGVLTLGVRLCELTGQSVSRYWGLMKLAADVELVNTDIYFADADGRVYRNRAQADLTTREEEILRLRESVIYDALYGRRYITEEMNLPPE